MDYLNIAVSKVLPALTALFLIYKLLRFGHRDKRLPPGPPTIPILGNAHLIPTHNLHKKFKQWADEYGPIFSLKIGAGTIVVLNDRTAVHSLIDKRSAIYSDRALDHNADIALAGENLSFMHATPTWRAQRKIAAQTLAPASIDKKIAPVQEAEICQLMYDLLTTPERFADHIKRVTASTAAIVIFGHRAPTLDSFWNKCVYDTMEILNPVLEPGAALPIEQFPILKLIPDIFLPSVRRAKRAYTLNNAVWADAQRRIQERRSRGDYRPSIADRIFSGEAKMDVPLTTQSQISGFFAVLHQGASDTTSSMLLTHILFLAKYPWVQDKARIEIDRLCGTERMPVWQDFKDLPYVNCIVKEGLRMRPVAPLNLPHRVNRDDYYETYLIPKDSTIFFPAWTLHHQFPDAETYNPDRYLHHPKLAMEYAGSPDFMNRDHYSYGSGRRICPGIHLAERTQWRIVARLLWAFRIEPAVDERGESVELDTDAYVEGFLTQPLPFSVRFTPRSERHKEVVRRDYRDVEEFLRGWE